MLFFGRDQSKCHRITAADDGNREEIRNPCLVQCIARQLELEMLVQTDIALLVRFQEIEFREHKLNFTVPLYKISKVH